MGITKGLSRLGVLLGSLGVIAVAFAGAAPASMAMIPAPGDTGGATGTDTVAAPPPWSTRWSSGACPAGRSP